MNTLLAQSRLAVMVAVFGSFTLLSTVPVPILDVNDLVARSPVIVVGQIGPASNQGRTTISVGGRPVPARRLVAVITVHRVLKGSASSTLEVEYEETDERIGYGSVPPGQVRVFLLTPTADAFWFTSPYYPSVVGARTAPASTTPLDRVADVVGAVLSSAESTESHKREALYTLMFTRSARSIEAVKPVLAESKVEFRLMAAGALLNLDSVDGLPVAERALLRPDPSVPPHLLHNLRAGIEERLSRQEAVPTLVRLMKAADPATRRAVSAALRRIRTPEAVPPLVSALYDPDQRVRYNAVVGLAEYAGQLEWRPSIPAFDADEQHYLEHWRAWGKARFRL